MVHCSMVQYLGSSRSLLSIHEEIAFCARSMRIIASIDGYSSWVCPLEMLCPKVPRVLSSLFKPPVKFRPEQALQLWSSTVLTSWKSDIVTHDLNTEANMATLKLAVRANQALLLPPLLVATYAEQVNSNEKTKTHFEDADSLDSGATIAQLTKGGDVFTNDSIISELLKDVSSPKSSHSESVCLVSLPHHIAS